MTRLKKVSVYCGIVLILLAMSPTISLANASQIYFNDFDGGLIVAPGVTDTLGGIKTIESVQDYDGIGPGSNTFGGEFLRNTTGGPLGESGSPTTLTLTGLPPHTSVDINFLLAIIDSWDGSEPGTGSGACTDCHPDILTVTIDGNAVFSEAFGFNGPIFDPPSGVSLVENHLGFNLNDRDAAYDMGLNPTFDGIPHCGDTLTIEWVASGDGWQGGLDESWAIDNLEVVLNEQPVGGDGPKETTEGVMDELQSKIVDHTGTPMADKLEDAWDKLEVSLEELNKEPPDNQAVVGNLEGAVGELEAAVEDGYLDSETGDALMGTLVCIARQLAQDALDYADANGGDEGDIDDALGYMAEGDDLRASGKYKDAVNKYKDALSKAEGAI